MQRRHFLTASTGALCALPLLSSPLQAMSWCLGGARSGDCALHRLPALSPLGALSEGDLRIGQYWPAQIKPASLAVWSVDLEIVDQDGIPRRVYAWQLTRSVHGADSPANSLRMRVPETSSIGLSATMKHRDALGRLQPQHWHGQLHRDSSMLLTTSRASTGLPPVSADLRFNAEQRALQLADGGARDFDALLIQVR